MKKILTHIILAQLTVGVLVSDQDFSKCMYITPSRTQETIPCRNKAGKLLADLEKLPKDSIPQSSLFKRLLYKIGSLTTPHEKNIVWLKKNLFTPLLGHEIDRIAVCIALHTITDPTKQALIKKALASIPSSNETTINNIARDVTKNAKLTLEEKYDMALRRYAIYAPNHTPKQNSLGSITQSELFTHK